MKNKKILTTIVTAFTAASLLFTGCASQTKDETPETEQTEKETEETTKKTEKETEEETEKPTESEEEMDEFYDGEFEWPSMSGIEGAEEYIVAIDWDNINYDNLPDDWTLQDINTIEDEELRNTAQSYIDQGFTVDDPALDQQYGFAYGDGDYMFNQGFTAYKETQTSYEAVAVYRMNEALFEDFYTSYVDASQRTDDGTIVRVGADDCYVEFNRDTGIGTYYTNFNPAMGLG
ncbi:MAG: hypothetical protein IKT14_07215 [Clostridiales bacterium]|nr:hypothetical protein [Clostridiales bacterium]MBR6484795.1 hypothetical protein [Clostridiales bacterium]